MSQTGDYLKTLPCGRQSVGLARVLFAFDEALDVGFFAWLNSDRGALSLGDRLPANHTDGFLTMSLPLHKGTPHSFLTSTVAGTLHNRGWVVSDLAHCPSGRCSRWRGVRAKRRRCTAGGSPGAECLVRERSVAVAQQMQKLFRAWKKGGNEALAIY